MSKQNKQDDCERIELDEHERLTALFREDRLSFERERKCLIEAAIAAAPDEKCKKKLTLQQQQLDKILQRAGSRQNRLAMMQALFWDHYVNEFLPALNRFIQELDRSPLQPDSITHPELSLIKNTICGEVKRNVENQ